MSLWEYHNRKKASKFRTKSLWRFSYAIASVIMSEWWWYLSSNAWETKKHINHLEVLTGIKGCVSCFGPCCVFFVNFEHNLCSMHDKSTYSVAPTSQDIQLSMHANIVCNSDLHVLLHLTSYNIKGRINDMFVLPHVILRRAEIHFLCQPADSVQSWTVKNRRRKKNFGHSDHAFWVRTAVNKKLEVTQFCKVWCRYSQARNHSMPGV